MTFGCFLLACPRKWCIDWVAKKKTLVAYIRHPTADIWAKLVADWGMVINP